MEELRIYLKENGISVLAFSRKLGCSRDTINKWLAGVTRPSLRMLKRIEIITKGKVTRWHFYPEFK